jgi:anthranilate phosphoribosyltransferase
MDELSVSGPSTVVEVRKGEVEGRYQLEPEDCGVPRHDQIEIAGGDSAENAAIIRRVLAGEPGAPRDVVLLNAAAALYVAGAAPSVKAGVGRAAESIDSGRAAQVLADMAALTSQLAGGSR